jgi:hypothetical protein
MRGVLGGLGLALVLLWASTPTLGQEKVQVNVVTYEELGDIVRQLKGKVVVVDFWADT